jgi:hypothetical protein
LSLRQYPAQYGNHRNQQHGHQAEDDILPDQPFYQSGQPYRERQFCEIGWEGLAAALEVS